ncbi:unnamed protein product [Clonostachys byssicola]|uniref:Nuclear GTPase SLIP-GC n=1 Tax=Clonostachys byssicola TaxID=160290 RepID=A0A9N9U4U0_9HYPO|nr:unnamed protein product [Clonostachys byssicola]
MSPAKTSTSADTPIPSIETDSWVRDSSEETESSIGRLRTPSVSISPPPDALSNGVRSESLGLESQMQTMRLASKDKDKRGLSAGFTDLLHAVDAAEREPTQPVSITPAPRPDPSTPRRARRRSGRSPSASYSTRHNVHEEPLPEDIFHSPAFQQALRDAKSLTADLKAVMDDAPLLHDHESTISKLHEEAVKLSSFEYPTSRRIGFVGDSGVGKSSLLNSLLDYKDLARASNSGEACTCVVTEYHYHQYDHMDVQVELFTTQELNEQLERMLEDFRHYSFHAEEMTTAEEKKSAKDRAHVAKDTFKAMFRGRMNNDSFLLQGSQREVLQTLIRWAEEQRPSRAVTSQQNLSLDQCSDSLFVLSSERLSRTGPAIWPFIKTIKVFLNAHALKQGLVLVDLPGLRDLNSARRCITERYILECNEIFVICNIGRAVTDEGVLHVFNLAQRARLRNVGIVCTRSEDIVPSEALRDWDGTRQARIKSLIAAIDEDKQHDKELKAEILELDKLEDDGDLSEVDREERNLLGRDKRQLEKKIENGEFELTQFLVTTRNEFVTNKLSQKYAHRVDGLLRVFCVSNKLYNDKRNEPKDRALPYLKLSGIIDLRKHCISIVAQAQRRVVVQFINDEIPALLSKIQLWVQSGARTADQERRIAIIAALDNIERELRTNLRRHSRPGQTMQRDFNTLVLGRIQLLSWTQFAADTSLDRNGWHHSSYSAFVSNFGNHSTPKAGTHDWNLEAMEKMVEDLRTPWESLASTLYERQSELTQAIETTTETIRDSLENELDDNDESTNVLLEALEAQTRLLQRSMEACFENLTDKFLLLHTDTFSGIRTSLFGKEMEPTYRRCNQEYGTGSDRRRKTIMNGGFSNQVLFRNVMKASKELFERITDDLQSEWVNAQNDYLKLVEDILDLVRSEKAIRESEQDPGFRDRVDDTIRRGNDDIRRIQDAVRE